MENEMVGAVLNEILTEQKDAVELLEEMGKKLATVAEQLEKINERLENQDKARPANDVLPVQSLVVKGMGI